MKVSFFNSKGQKLVGLLDLPKVKNPPVVITLHGLKAHKTYFNFINYLAKVLAQNNIAVRRFDFNTHGESEGDWQIFTRMSCAGDFEAAVNFVKKQKLDSKRIGVFATSMGAVAFFYRPKGIKGAVLHDPYFLPSLWKGWIGKYEKEIRRRGYIQLFEKKTGREVKYGLPLLEESLDGNDAPLFAQKVKMPTLLLFSEKYDLAIGKRKKTCQLFSGKKEMETIWGMGHTKAALAQSKKIAKLSLDWFQKYL